MAISKERNTRGSVIQLAKVADQRGNLMRKVLLRSPATKTSRGHVEYEIQKTLKSVNIEGAVDLKTEPISKSSKIAGKYEEKRIGYKIEFNVTALI